MKNLKKLGNNPISIPYYFFKATEHAYPIKKEILDTCSYAYSIERF
jgi:hypothetical protein